MELLIETLKTGGVILYPTDTIWGIGCDARCASYGMGDYGFK